MHDVEYLTNFLISLEREGKSRNTLMNYNLHLVKFRRFCLSKGLGFLSITASHLLTFRESLLSLGLMNKTVNAVIGAVRRFYDYMVIMGYVSANPVPMTLRLKSERNQVPALTIEEQQAVFSEISGYQENVRLCFLLLFSTGLRVSEVANLRKNNFFIEDGRLVVDVVGSKWNSDRKIAVMDGQVAADVWRYICQLEDGDSPAFRLSKRTIQFYAQQIKEKTGVSFYCHRIRHSFANQLLESGQRLEVIQAVMGHTSVNMTKWYAVKNPDSVSIAPRLGEKKKVFYFS